MNLKKSRDTSPYFAYMSGDNKRITTWVGDKLGDVTFIGREYGGGFGGVRQNFRMEGVDGRTWSGTFFKSSGDYVRMKPTKKI